MECASQGRKQDRGRAAEQSWVWCQASAPSRSCFQHISDNAWRMWTFLLVWSGFISMAKSRVTGVLQKHHPLPMPVALLAGASG